MQKEALAVATVTKVKCTEVKESYVPCTIKCFCCKLAHVPMITEERAVCANHHEFMNATGSLEISLGPEQRGTMRCMERIRYGNNTAKKKRALEFTKFTESCYPELLRSVLVLLQGRQIVSNKILS
jgi:hypothetical protein